MEVILNDIEKEIKILDSQEKGRFKNITPKSLEEAPDVCILLLQDIRAE